MFFVTIGIAILFSSFIIALFSLIREQNEQQEFTVVPEVEVPEVVQTKRQDEQDNWDEPQVVVGERPQGVEPLVADAVFPWDGPREMESGDSSSDLANEVPIGRQNPLSGGFSLSELRRKAA